MLDPRRCLRLPRAGDLDVKIELNCSARLDRDSGKDATMAARKSPPLDDATILDWVGDSAGPATSSPHDPEVVRTIGHHREVVVQPSAQQVVSQPPPVVSQPQVVVQQQPVTTTLQTTPTV